MVTGIMHTHKPTVAYSLDGQIDLFIHARSNQILRTVSFDNGDEWMEWVEMKEHKTKRTVGFASTPDSSHKYMAYRVVNPFEGLPMEDTFEDDRRYVVKRSARFGFDWSDTTEDMGPDEFLSGPAIVCTPDGNTVHLFGQGTDQKVRWSKSDYGAVTWLWRGNELGDAVFKSEPAAVMSADGNTILVFAIGLDDRCWYTRTSDAGQSWNPLWAPIEQGVFTSGPSACISADGGQVIVAARGRDDRIFFNRSADGGATWRKNWEPILSGVFEGGPGLCASWDFGRVFVFAVGRDHKIWKAYAEGADAPFAGWWVADRHNKLGTI